MKIATILLIVGCLAGTSTQLDVVDGICHGNILGVLNLDSLASNLQQIVAKVVCKSNAIITQANAIVLTKESLDVLRQTFHCCSDQDTSTPVCAQINSNVPAVQAALVKELKQFCKSIATLSQSQVIGGVCQGNILQILNLGSLAQSVQVIVAKAICKTNAIVNNCDVAELSKESLDVLRQTFHCCSDKDTSTPVCAQINSNVPSVKAALVNELKQFCQSLTQPSQSQCLLGIL